MVCNLCTPLECTGFSQWPANRDSGWDPLHERQAPPAPHIPPTGIPQKRVFCLFFHFTYLTHPYTKELRLVDLIPLLSSQLDLTYRRQQLHVLLLWEFCLALKSPMQTSLSKVILINHRRSLATLACSSWLAFLQFPGEDFPNAQVAKPAPGRILLPPTPIFVIQRAYKLLEMLIPVDGGSPRHFKEAHSLSLFTYPTNVTKKSWTANISLFPCTAPQSKLKAGAYQTL